MRSIASGAGSATTLELVAAAGAIAAELAGREAPEPGMAALELAEALGGAMDVMEAALARLVGRVDDTGVFGELGFSSTGAWLRNRLGMRDGRAAERVRLARQLPRLGEVAKRLGDGALSAGYAGAIADAVARLDDIDAELGERLLLGLVEQGHTAGQVAKDGAQITDLINQHRGKEKEPEDSKRGFARSWITKAKSLDGGLWLRGWLSPEHAAAFEQIIGSLAKPKVRGDDRDLGQRTADALMSALSEGNKNAGVTVIIDLAAFTEATGDTGPFDFTTSTRTAAANTGPHQNGSGSHPDRPNPGSGSGSVSGPGTNTRPGDGADPGLGEDPRTTAGDHATDNRVTQETLDGLAEVFDLDGMCGGTTGNKPGEAAGSDSPPPDRQSDSIAVQNDPPGEPGHPPRLRPDAMSHRPGPPERRKTDHRFDETAGDGTGTGPRDEHEPAHEFQREHGPGRVAARLLNGTPISPDRARQIALNAGINALILGRDGLPIYLGRTVRFATPAQRKVLLALYETCCIQGCEIPAHLCEIHHLDGGWKLTTPTDIDKLAPACAWHNRWIETHADQVEETRDHHGRTFVRLLPPWERRTTRAASYAS